MKTAFKATDQNLRCRDVQYQIGKTYILDENNKVVEAEGYYFILKPQKIVLCSKLAIHYCNTLEQTFTHYANKGINRFFEIEVFGETVESSDKCGVRAIKFLREIPPKELEQITKQKDDKFIASKMNIETVKTLQEAHPELIIGGSIALFLYGVRLERFKSSIVDFDITLPYWKNLSVGEKIKHEDLEDRPSGSDYTETCTINGIKADIRIEPKQKYNLVEFDNFKFKVIPLHTIIEAKAKYAHSIKGGEKHRKDLNGMILGEK